MCLDCNAPSNSCDLHNITLHIEHCTLNTVHCTLHIEHCTLHIAHCTFNIQHPTLHWISLYCMLLTANHQLNCCILCFPFLPEETSHLKTVSLYKTYQIQLFYSFFFILHLHHLFILLFSLLFHNYSYHFISCSIFISLDVSTKVFLVWFSRAKKSKAKVK